jgi:flagella synthesis protein FlgN
VSQKDKLLAVVAADIAADLNTYEQLQRLLDELHERLLARDTLAIEQLNQRIESCLNALAECSTRRGKVLRAFGLSADPQGMQRLLAAYPATQVETVRSQWQQLGQAVRDCRQRNERNGRLLAMHNDILNQLLSGTGDGTALYGQQDY